MSENKIVHISSRDEIAPEEKDLILLHRQDGCLIVSNNDPIRRNPLSPRLFAKIHEALDIAELDETIDAVILTGSGGYFCAGGNLPVLKERVKMSLAERKRTIDRLQNLIRAIRACPKPVIAAIDGGAAGAGVSIALACDLIVSDKSARFSVAYVKVGLVPDGGITSFLAKSLPAPLVNELCLLGRPISAPRLHHFGLINELCEPGESLAVAIALADQFAGGPQRAIGAIKSLLESACHQDLDSQLVTERNAMALALEGDEAQEGIAAFLEKRSPSFPR